MIPSPLRPSRLSSLALALTLAGFGCVPVRVVLRDLESAEKLIEQVRGLNGEICAPVPFADATSDAAFARLELESADPARAREHTSAAMRAAKAAYEASATCGSADIDGDTIPDVLDRCPKEPEDLDGVNDTDGCPDLDPYGDADNDGYRNLDDDCPKEAEDFDGHNDADGCPETSEDADGDSIVDAADKCPDESEDFDGFKDGDGCPDPDNDKDGVPDGSDACPTQAEDTDGFDDTDGCPDWDNDADGVDDSNDDCPLAAGAPEARGCPVLDRDLDTIPDALDTCPDQPEDLDGTADDDGCPD
jgi:hypothetical protein